MLESGASGLVRYFPLQSGYGHVGDSHPDFLKALGTDHKRNW